MSARVGYRLRQKFRNRGEEMFGWIKTVGGLRRSLYRGGPRPQAWGDSVVAAYHLVRMVRLRWAAARQGACGELARGATARNSAVASCSAAGIGTSRPASGSDQTQPDVKATHLTVPCEKEPHVSTACQRTTACRSFSMAAASSLATSRPPPTRPISPSPKCQARNRGSWRHYLLDPARLQPGQNLLAVSLHPSPPTNAALTFDLQLTAGLYDVRPQPLTNQMELRGPTAFNSWQCDSTSALELEGGTPVHWPVLRDEAWHYVPPPATSPARFYGLGKPRLSCGRSG